MAIFNAYNLMNQKLDSDSLKILLGFCSDNYAGCIYADNNESPLNIDGTTVTLDGNASFIVDGFLIQATELSNSYTLNSENNFYGIVIKLSSIKQNAKITTNEISNDDIKIGSIIGFTITENEDGTYNILRESDNSGWSPYLENTKKFTTIEMAMNDPITDTEICVIPLACYFNNEVIDLLGYRTKSSLEEFLTKVALDKLKSELIGDFEDKFVWKSGGSGVGDIGNLNITDNTISATGNDEIHLDANNIVFDKFKNKALVTDENGKLGNNTVAVSQGGTGADNRKDAKQNLGIYVGTKLPTSVSGFSLNDIFLLIVDTE